MMIQERAGESRTRDTKWDGDKGYLYKGVERKGRKRRRRGQIV